MLSEREAAFIALHKDNYPRVYSFADRTSQNGAGGDPVFASLEEARAYMTTPEYRKLKAMLTSLQMW